MIIVLIHENGGTRVVPRLIKGWCVRQYPQSARRFPLCTDPCAASELRKPVMKWFE